MFRKRVPFRRGAFPPVPPLLHYSIVVALFLVIAFGLCGSVCNLTGMLPAGYLEGTNASKSLFSQGVDPAEFGICLTPTPLVRRVRRAHERLRFKQLARIRETATKASMNYEVTRSLFLIAGIDVATPRVI